MPLIKIERIVSFTSEDPFHTANNVLLKDTSKKWKCKVPGEKSASVVLQLDQPYVISGIDIGNEHSAYIEVLVSRSTLPDDYKVFLVMSSFMTPLEARQSQNVNKVRMFKQEDLSEPERNEKWDRVMIVCTQPFNRHVQYGLSFINLYTNDKNMDNTTQPLIGKFIVRPDSPDNISAGSLFARRKELQESTPKQILKGAAAIREATSLAHIVSPAIKHNLKRNLPLTPDALTSDMTDKTNYVKPRNRDELLYSKDEEDEQDKVTKIIEQKSEEKAEVNKPMAKHKDVYISNEEKRGDGEKEKKKEPHKNMTVEVEFKTKKNGKTKNNLQNESNKRKKADELGHNIKKQKRHVGKPFARLLEDVVFVISGIQNPDRASLRSMALSMGAKYKADWDNSCTHLVCAFANTPKFNQVKGKGKIVKRSWLEDCFNNKKRIPWRKYALDNADKGVESEEEICELEEEKYVENSNIESDTEMQEEGSDTEDKIQQIKNKQKPTTSTEIFQTDTDNEVLHDNSHNSLKIEQDLKYFFHDKIFYVDNVFDVEMERKIKRYIVAYKGKLENNIQPGVDVIITNNSNYKNVKNVCSSATCVASDWIWDCHNCQKVVPMENYIFD